LSQVSRRFPKAMKILVVGDLSGHYYNEESPFDVIVLAPKEVLTNYKHEADFVSGYILKNTAHKTYFYVMDSSIRPELIADKFGPTYDVFEDRWVGKRVTGTTEMTRPEALLQMIKWKLYKAKEMDEEPFPYEWRILAESMEHLSGDDRKVLLNELKQVVARLENSIGKVLNKYNDAAVWRNASTLKRLFDEAADDDDIKEFIDAQRIPAPVVMALMNTYRYADVLDQIEDIDERLRQRDELDASKRGVSLRSITGSKKSTLGSWKAKRLHDVV
jgi:hypothetical protein